MSYIIKRPWRSQPQNSVDLNPSLTRPLCVMWGGNPVTQAGAAVTVNGTVGRRFGNGGIGSSHASGSTNIARAVIPGSSIGSGGGATLLCVFRSSSTETDKRIGAFGSDDGESGNTIFSIGTGSATASELRITAGGGSQNYAYDFAGTNITDGKAHAVVLSVDLFSNSTSSNCIVAMDGKVLYNASSTDLGTSTIYNWLVAGGFRRGGTDSAGASCDVLLLAGYDRQLSVAESIALTINPWQLFKPRRAVFHASAAAGYTHPTLSNARMGSMTATGGVPKVDYAF